MTEEGEIELEGVAENRHSESPSMIDSGLSVTRARSSAARSQEERRRRILERGEARIKRILGRSPDIPQETVEEVESGVVESRNLEPETGPSEPDRGPSEPHTGPSEPDAGPSEPDTTRREELSVEEIIAHGSVSEEEDEPEDVQNTLISYSTWLFFYVLFVKLVYTFGMKDYVEEKNLSYVTPFFAIELIYFLQDSVIVSNGPSLLTTIRQMSWLELIFKLIFFLVPRILSHLSVYFLSVCFFHKVFAYFDF